MNERIKELMQKTPHKVIHGLIQNATGYSMQVYEVNGVRTLGERVEFFDKEKFAELIAKECANAIREAAKRFPPTDLLWIGAMEESANVVIKHFGVTE
jgi:hypothetical protein